MQVFLNLLLLAVVAVKGSLLSQDSNADIHFGKTSSIVIDTEPHPVYDHHLHRHLHHNEHLDHHDHADVQITAVAGSATATATKLIDHEPIHQLENVHHVTKVVHHEPHHFVHYVKPEVDHHIVHQNRHLDEHHHAADLHHDELHNGLHSHYHSDAISHSGSAGTVVRYHTAPDVLYHHPPTAVVHQSHPHYYNYQQPQHLHHHRLVHTKYPTLRITEKHY